MNEADKNKRIEQMRSFILQEARDKSNEITLKTENDFSLEKQLTIHRSKLSLETEIKNLKNEIQTSKLVAKAKQQANSRLELFQSRQDMLSSITDEALDQLAKKMKESPDTYSTLLKKLIIQGLIRLNEKKVDVVCSSADKGVVEKVVEDSIQEYKDLIASEVGENVDVAVNVLPDLKDGELGVVLKAFMGRVVVDNRLSSRMDIAFQQLMPQIRSSLFSTKI